MSLAPGLVEARAARLKKVVLDEGKNLVECGFWHSKTWARRQFDRSFLPSSCVQMMSRMTRVLADFGVVIVAEEVPVLWALIMKTVIESKDGRFYVNLTSIAVFDDLLETQKGVVREDQAKRCCLWLDLLEPSAGRDKNLTDPPRL